MAAPVAAIATLPDDSGNVGKKVRTQTRVVGANTVHEHFFVPASIRSLLGRHFTHSGNLTVQASAHTFGSTGFLFAVNPIGSTAKVAINRLYVSSQMTTALVAVTAPRLMWTTFTFTGTASGTALTNGKKRSADTTAQFTIRTAFTGLTMTKVCDALSVLPIASSTAVSYAPTSQWEFVANGEDDEIELLAGEGLCLWQIDAGTVSDTRKVTAEIHWKEFE